MAWYPKILLAKQIQDDLSLDTVNGCVIGLKRVGVYLRTVCNTEWAVQIFKYLSSVDFVVKHLLVYEIPNSTSFGIGCNPQFILKEFEIDLWTDIEMEGRQLTGWSG